MPIRFKRCEVIIKPWEIPDLVIPPEESASYTLEFPTFTYQSAIQCNYDWERIRVTVKLLQLEEDKMESSTDGKR